MKIIYVTIVTGCLIISYCGCSSITDFEREQMITKSEHLLQLDSAHCDGSIDSFRGLYGCLEIAEFNYHTIGKGYSIVLDSIWVMKPPDPHMIQFYHDHKKQFRIRYKCISCPKKYNSITFFFGQEKDKTLVFKSALINFGYRERKGGIDHPDEDE